MPEKEKARKDDMLAFSFPFLIDAQLELNRETLCESVSPFVGDYSPPFFVPAPFFLSHAAFLGVVEHTGESKKCSCSSLFLGSETNERT